MSIHKIENVAQELMRSDGALDLRRALGAGSSCGTHSGFARDVLRSDVLSIEHKTNCVTGYSGLASVIEDGASLRTPTR